MQTVLGVHSFSPIPCEVVALIDALHLDRPTYDGLRDLDRDKWESLLRFSDMAHLTLPLAIRNVQGLPKWVSRRLAQNLSDNAARFERVKSTYLEIATVLEAAGIDHIVIKGFTLAPDYVESPYLRQQSDLDLYCRSEAIADAQRTLESIGYRSDRLLNYTQADHEPTLLRLGEWKWRGNAFDPDMPLSAELHFCLWNEKTSLISIPEVECFWSRREYRTVEGMRISSLSQIDLFGHLTLHIVRNLLSRDSIVHHVYELASFLSKRRQDDDFWESWAELTTPSLKSKEVLAFELARQWFGCPLPEIGLNELALLPKTQRAWLRHFGRSALEGLFLENKDVFWLHWSLLAGGHERLKLLRRTFIPNRIPDPDLPVVAFSNRAIPNSKANRSMKLLSYLVRRTLSYSVLHFRTLYRGVLWFAQREHSF
jgi:hypothetical protein